jgi:hypothetical protein
MPEKQSCDYWRKYWIKYYLKDTVHGYVFPSNRMTNSLNTLEEIKR